jgi:hypothetical protein
LYIPLEHLLPGAALQKNYATYFSDSLLAPSVTARLCGMDVVRATESRWPLGMLAALAVDVEAMIYCRDRGRLPDL